MIPLCSSASIITRWLMLKNITSELSICLSAVSSRVVRGKARKSTRYSVCNSVWSAIKYTIRRSFLCKLVGSNEPNYNVTGWTNKCKIVLGLKESIERKSYSETVTMRTLNRIHPNFNILLHMDELLIHERASAAQFPFWLDLESIEISCVYAKISSDTTLSYTETISLTVILQFSFLSLICVLPS